MTVYVTSTRDPELLGSCGSEPTGGNQPGFVRSVMSKKIIEGIDDNGDEPDAELSMNFMDVNDPEWAYDDNIPEDKYDFQDTLIHELTHALGYLNAVGPGGGGMLEGLPAFSPQKWYAWDYFLADDDANRLVNSSSYVFDQALLPTLTNGAMFFDGPNARQGNNGEMVQIYAPRPWSDGSSASHIDTNYPPITTMFWTGSHGPGCRGYSPSEAGILVDLGYDLIDVSAPTNLTATTGLAGRVELSWQAPPYSRTLSNVVGYAVYRGATAVAAQAGKLADTDADTLAYVDETALENTSYYYWVRAKYDHQVPQTSLMRTAAVGRWGQHPEPALGPALRANGRRGIVQVNHPGTVALTATMRAGDYLNWNVDFFVVAIPSFGTECYYLDRNLQWQPFAIDQPTACPAAYTGPWLEFDQPYTLLPATALDRGTYNIYFIVDYPGNGVMDLLPNQYVLDMVKVQVD